MNNMAFWEALSQQKFIFAKNVKVGDRISFYDERKGDRVDEVVKIGGALYQIKFDSGRIIEVDDEQSFKWYEAL